MRPLRARLHILAAIAAAAALAWGSGAVATALPQSERLRADVHTDRVVDYATNVVGPGSRFTDSRPTYDQ